MRSFALSRTNCASLDYGPMFPAAMPVKLVRRATLSCSAATGECSFILLLPEETRAVN